MYFADEVRTAEGLDIKNLEEKVKISTKEEELAIEIVNNLTDKFEPEKYTDEYREELMKIIRGKIEGKDDVEIPEVDRTENKILDLMEKLRASVEASEKQARKEKKEKKTG